MSEPEQLEGGPSRPLNRRVVVAVVVVAALVLGLGTVWGRHRADQTVPTPTPTPARTATTGSSPESPASSAPTPSGPVTLWREPSGEKDRLVAARLPAGTLYARSRDTLYAIDLHAGSAVAIPIQTATSDAVSMVPTSNGIAIRPWDDTAGLLVGDGQSPVDLPGKLEAADEILPGPAGHLWALTRSDNAPFGSTATLVDQKGRQDGPALSTDGYFEGDGADGLLLADVGGVWEAGTAPLRQVTDGNVTSVGRQHYLLLECDRRHRCTESLLDRRNHRRTPLSPRPRTLGNGLISPTGAYLASVDVYRADGSQQVQVRRLADNRVLQELSDPPNTPSNQPGAIAWLSDRWLVAITDGQLSLYDTTNDRVVPTELGFTGLLQIAWRPR